MKIVVMSDTHLSHVTEEFMAICARHCSQADMVIHLGDWERTPVLDYMEQYPLEAVSGNMDDHIIRDRLPAKKIVRAGKYLLGLTHGWGPGADLRERVFKEFTGVDAILFGHTHQAVQIEEKGIFCFNPGSVFSGRGGSPRSLGILHIEETITGQIVPL
jgi:uncharacterized protein